MKIIFGTIIYDAALKWSDEFIKSVNSQIYLDFDVLIINDGVVADSLDQLVKKIDKKCISYNAKPNNSISENRIELLTKAKKLNYDVIIFGDFDDTFSENRVQYIIDSIDCVSTFYYHNIIYGNSKRVLFSRLPLEITKINLLLQANFLGMSNTALDLRNLDFDWVSSLQNVKTNIFDWYLFSRLIISKKYGKLVEGASTYYRLHNNNLAGVVNSFTKNLEREAYIKLEQYSMLKKYDTVYDKLYKVYAEIISNHNYDYYMNSTLNGYWWEFLKVEVPYV